MVESFLIPLLHNWPPKYAHASVSRLYQFQDAFSLDCKKKNSEEKYFLSIADGSSLGQKHVFAVHLPSNWKWIDELIESINNYRQEWNKSMIDKWSNKQI
jgi:hypothetical protein